MGLGKHTCGLLTNVMATYWVLWQGALEDIHGPPEQNQTFYTNTNIDFKF